MRKFIYWCYNYHTPKIWIEYITKGSKAMFDHFYSKWCSLYKQYGGTKAMLEFYINLDRIYQDRLEEYINKYYETTH